MGSIFLHWRWRYRSEETREYRSLEGEIMDSYADGVSTIAPEVGHLDADDAEFLRG